MIAGEPIVFPHTQAGATLGWSERYVHRRFLLSLGGLE
jgi:hypothetical protein